MFDNLTDRLSGSLRKISGQAKLTENNISETLREVRMALLEADVALPVVKDFVENVRQKAMGQEVMRSLTPGQAFIKLVQGELEAVMGAAEPLSLEGKPPAVIMMAGLQGAGKTTSVAKLARYLKEREKKSVLVVSADVYRPAAINQLETLAGEVDATFYASSTDQDPVTIANNAVDEARRRFIDVVIVDTAGRLHVDDSMMDEIGRLNKAVQPNETLFVVDAMSGQDAANTAKAFSEALPLSGVILTKADGDARGGAALSVRHITGRPIKFMGVGEKNDALEVFHPDRIASRILGMGDVLSLIEDAEQKVDQKKAQKLTKKIKKGKKFDLEDFRDQLQQMKSMGGMGAMLEKMPGMGQYQEMAEKQVNDKSIGRMEAIISSMTAHERRYPDVISSSRKRRIAFGSGVQMQEINRLLKQHKQMQKMMKKMGKKGGMENMMQGMQGMMGQGGSGGPGGPGGMGGGGMPPMGRR